MGIIMNKEILFANALEELKRTAKEQGNCISREQITSAFKEMELSLEQMELVTDYLKKQRIGIGEPVEAEEYLTKEETDYLEAYLEELKHLEQAVAGEREAVTLSAMAGDARAQSRLIEIYLPEVVEIAKLYGGQGVYLEDLIGEGNLALAMGVTMLGCMEHADEAQGMLGKMIMDAMEEHIAGILQEKQTDKVVVDKVNDVTDHARELAEVLQRKVTVAELSQESKLSEEIILEAIRMSGDNIEYIEKR